MSLKEQIIELVHKKGKIKASEIVDLTGFSRSYVNYALQDLRNEGRLILIGRANQAHYIPSTKKALLAAKKQLLSIRKTLKNSGFTEDTVLDWIKQETGIFLDLKSNVDSILNYAFTEMLNNAIEHSQSKTIEIRMKRTDDLITFSIKDLGIGIFKNIMDQKHLRNELEAIQDLLKGKQTTMPQEHSGEGIFFTSKLADTLVIESSKKKLLFNNIVEDIFLQDIHRIKGTTVLFTINLNTKKITEDVFKEYTGDSFEFDRTKVIVRLYKMGSMYISRSQARRILSGLIGFRTVVMDFNHITTVGQAFADEIFRVWQNHNPDVKIKVERANENVNFMISRARHEGVGDPSQQSLFSK